MTYPGGSDGKESACNARDLGSIPGLGRFPGWQWHPVLASNGKVLQYSCLENSMDRVLGGGLKSMGLPRVWQNWELTHTHVHTREKSNLKWKPVSIYVFRDKGTLNRSTLWRVGITFQGTRRSTSSRSELQSFLNYLYFWSVHPDLFIHC